jgi:CubicO group peptidase (beta-lactamase class C family)
MNKITYISILFISISGLVFGQDTGFTGYAVSLIKNNQIEYGTYGVKDKERKVKYDSLTIQPVGSVSKVVIGLALMKAVELGFINLDTDINQYINFKVINPNFENSTPITLRHLATHTSGIIDNVKFYRQSYTKGIKSSETLENYIQSYFMEAGGRYSKKNFGKYRAGEEYNYSNIGAALAAYIIESASKMPFDQFTDKYIFQPLEMTYTHWFYNENLTEFYTQLFDKRDKPLSTYTLTTYPDGALKMNILDFSKLLLELINGYNGNGNILSQDSWKGFYAKNFSEINPVKGIKSGEPNSGIFIVYAKNGAIGHSGSDPGVCAFMFFNPETKEGKIFMANEDLLSKNIESFKKIWKELNLQAFSRKAGRSAELNFCDFCFTCRNVSVISENE